MAVEAKEIFRGGREQLRSTAKNIRKRKLKEQKDQRNEPRSPFEDDNGDGMDVLEKKYKKSKKADGHDESLIREMVSLKDYVPVEKGEKTEDTAEVAEEVEKVEPIEAGEKIPENGKDEEALRKEAVSFLYKTMAEMLRQRISAEKTESALPNSRPLLKREPDIYYMASVAGKDFMENGGGGIVGKITEAKRKGENFLLDPEDEKNMKSKISEADLNRLAFDVFVRNKIDAEIARFRKEAESGSLYHSKPKEVTAEVRSELTQQAFQDIAETSNVGKDFLVRRRKNPDARLSQGEIDEIETLISRKISEELLPDEPIGITVRKENPDAGAKPEAVAKTETAAETKPAIEFKPVAESKPVVDQKPAAESDPAVESKQETRPEPEIKTEIPVEPKTEAAPRKAEENIGIERMEELKAEVAAARKEYLETDYKKNTALARVRKFFGKIGGDPKGRNFEQDQDIAYFRAQYDNKLMDLQKLIVGDARERGASDEELAQLYAEFRTEQKIILADEHDKVRIEQQEGSLKGLVGEKMLEVTRWYRELPLKNKLALSAALMAGGVAVAGTAGTAAGVFAGIVAARRIFSGVTTGVGTALGLEAWGKKKDRESVEKDKQEFLRMMDGLGEQEKYDFLSHKIKNIAIRDAENTIDQVKNQDIRQLSAGALVGTFIGSGMAADLARSGFQKAHDFFIPGHADTAVPASASAHVEHAAPAAHTEALTVKEGSSIEKSIIEHIKANHPEIKDPGYAAHQMFRDYMHDNKDLIVGRVGQVEYDKMLKDGLINVKAGTGLNLVLDEHNKLSLHDIDGRISHIGSETHESLHHLDSEEVDKEPAHVSPVAENADSAALPKDVVEETVKPEPLPETAAEQAASHSEQVLAPLRLKSGIVSFHYDEHGEIMDERIILANNSYGTGRELLASDFDVRMVNAPRTAYRPLLSSHRWTMAQFHNMPIRDVELQDRVVVGHLKIYDELMQSGHKKEAAAILREVHERIGNVERNIGATVFDRTKIPSLTKE